jgi:predicted phage terminase large subunit-like protein
VSERAKVLIPLLYPAAKESSSRHEWRLPGGGKLLLRHLEDYSAAQKHRSAEYQFVAFDELTTFEGRQYRYLLTRLRSSHGLPTQVMSATNPGGPGHDWVKARWGPWLDKTHPTPAVSGEIRYYLTHPETGEDVWVSQGTPGALSRTFIAARLSDNKILCQSDPGYRAKLQSQDPLTRRQLELGDWDATAAPKTYFDRAWVPLVDEAPWPLRRVRYWDRAATEATHGKDPDWTAGVLLSRHAPSGLFFVEDLVRFRAGPAAVQQRIVETAAWDGLDVEQALSLDPGSAGVFEGDAYLRALVGYRVTLHRETGDKVTRAKPLSSLAAPLPGAQHGRLRVVRGRWVPEFFGELEEFPAGSHDDIVDAASGAFRVLCGADLAGGLDVALRTRRDPNRPTRKRGDWSTY